MKDTKIINRLDNLKKIRESKNITQIKLSTDLGVSQELISRYELGSAFPQPNMLIKLSNYFNCSVDYLLGITEIQTPVKFLASSSNIKDADILNKYNSLSLEDRKCLDRFLTFLVDTTEKSKE